MADESLAGRASSKEISDANFTFMSILTIGDDSWQCCCCRHVFTATNMKRNLHQDTFCSSFCYVINWN